ncbi:MAG TPA: sulfotransferase [Burkholderiales bacterium]|nr:sulfotransferase [Burkholderiales bacterium]
MNAIPSQPLVIIGAPRSGTTFLCHALNQHPDIELTNEGRIFALMKQILAVQEKRPDLLDRGIQASFEGFLRRHSGLWIERFYREELGITARIWGDKHPPYADPTLLSGRDGAAPSEPQSGSCLRLIRDLVPDVKFIHIHRDPVQVAHSLVRKGWIGTMRDGLEIWRQYLAEITGFLAELPDEQQLTVGHAELLTAPDDSALAIAQFLGLAGHEAILGFLDRQRHTPTPFSEPVSDFSRPFGLRFDRAPVSLGPATELAARLGYAETASGSISRAGPDAPGA